MTTVEHDRTECARPWATLDPPETGTVLALRSAIARRVFLAAMRRTSVSVEVEGRLIGRGGPRMSVVRPDELFARLAASPATGFGEAYLTGAWEADDLGGLIAALAARVDRLVPRALHGLRPLLIPRTPPDQRGERGDTRHVVAHHYDLSNDLFATFLDPTMSYSCARFRTDDAGRPIAGDDLEGAQLRKIDDLLDLAGVREGTRLLEIGSGWGALAIRAARRGAQVRTITLSSEQLDLARERVADAGLGSRVEVELHDYRDVEGSYDAVVSVEMIEAVGWRHWGAYFETLARVLEPGGVAAIQAITMPHGRMLATRDSETWMTRYIFPGGMLPSVRALREAATAHGLVLEEQIALGQHYAETLCQWDHRFLGAAAELDGLGFDETFRRMWHFYLQYSRGGFMAGYIDDHQLLFRRP